MTKANTGYYPLSKNIIISSIEFNQDYVNLRLDGVNCITLDTLIEQFKLYQKENGLRIEHKLKIPVRLETIVDMLKNFPFAADIKQDLSEMMKKQDVFLYSQKKIIELINALLNK